MDGREGRKEGRGGSVWRAVVCRTPDRRPVVLAPRLCHKIRRAPNPGLDARNGRHALPISRPPPAREGCQRAESLKFRFWEEEDKCLGEGSVGRLLDAQVGIRCAGARARSFHDHTEVNTEPTVCSRLCKSCGAIEKRGNVRRRREWSGCGRSISATDAACALL